MNLPNKLTVIRVFLIPLFICLLLTSDSSVDNILALTVYCIAAITDFFDGRIARKYNLVTNFGKFMDPLADKLLVCSAAICLVEMGRIPSWVVVIIVGREFVISGFRLIAVENGIVIAASMWGKIKTTVQMIMIILLILDFGGTFFNVLEQIFIYSAMVLSLVSLADYMYKNRQVLKEQN